MSIEKDLGRIADALEVLVCSLTQKPGSPVAKPVAAAPVTDAIPGVDEEIPGNAVPVEVEGTVKNGNDLRDLAQKYIQAAGDKANMLVAYIKDSICKKMNPAEPKLVRIPDAKCAEAADMIVKWAKKNKIELPIEV